MIRALIEFLLIIAVVMVARAVLTSIMKGVARASSSSFQGTSTNSSERTKAAPQTSAGGDLRKDPVCGTYVAEASALKRSVGGQVFYYCSEACREKHSLVAR
jgi:YHS domain-containing protein